MIKKLFFVVCFFFTVKAKTILVTGATGFIGSHVTEKLLDRGESVIITTHQQKTEKLLTKYNLKEKNNQLKIYQCNLNNKEDVSTIFNNEHIDVVCHLAAKSSVQESFFFPERYLENINTTLFLLEQIKHNKNIHFVFASSGTVYGNCKDIVFDETSRTTPCSVYAASKLTGENLAYIYHNIFGITCTCLRLFTIYGPGSATSAPFVFLNAIYNKKPIKLRGDGSTECNFLYIDDAVNAIMQAIDNPNKFMVLNIGNNKTTTLNNLIAMWEEILLTTAIIEKSEFTPLDGHIKHVNISKAQELLSFFPRTSLKEGLQKTYTWYKDEYLT